MTSGHICNCEWSQRAYRVNIFTFNCISDNICLNVSRYQGRLSYKNLFPVNQVAQNSLESTARVLADEGINLIPGYTNTVARFQPKLGLHQVVSIRGYSIEPLILFEEKFLQNHTSVENTPKFTFNTHLENCDHWFFEVRTNTPVVFFTPSKAAAVLQLIIRSTVSFI